MGNQSKTEKTKNNKHLGHKHDERKAKPSPSSIPTFKPSGNNAKSTDPEKSSDIETVGFLVSGMDCTSCVDKLMCVFGTITGVSQPRVNFIIGKGEVNIDTSITSADEVLRFVSTASGFSLSKIIGGDFFLDVLTSPAEGKRLAAEPPRGVTDIQSLDKKNVRLAYNPNIIGARDLFALVEDCCDGLAQPYSDPQLENSRCRLWDQFIKTALAAALTVLIAVLI